MTGNLLDQLALYASCNDVSSATVEQYRFAVLSLNAWAKRPVCADELTDELVNEWIAWLLQEGYARKTARNRRQAILLLWREAFDRKACTRLPQRVRTVKAPPPIPEAWDQSEMAKLLAVARKLEGRFPCGVTRAKLIEAAILVCWYTGLRGCDLVTLRSDQIDSRGTIVVRQVKTNNVVVCTLPQDVLQAIRETRPNGRDVVFPWTKKARYYWLKKVSVLAGLKGSPKWLRRSAATAVEIVSPGSAGAFLGHRTPGLAWKHYIDARQVQANRPLPPKIG